MKIPAPTVLSGFNFPLTARMNQQPLETPMRIPFEPFHDAVKSVLGILGLSGDIAYLAVAIMFALVALVAFLKVADMIQKALSKVKSDISGPAALDSYSEEELRKEIKKAVDASDWERAATLSENLRSPLEAARYWQKAGKHLKAAAIYEEKGKYSSAAVCYAAVQQYEKAADLYIKANETASAAAAFEKARNFGMAAVLYDRIERFDKSAGLLDLHLKSQSAAVRDIGLLNKSGEIYERAGRLQSAAECFTQAGSFSRAAEIQEKLGNRKEAADLYLKGKDLERAAALYEDTGETGKAGELRGILFSAGGDYAGAGEKYLEAGDYFRAGECFRSAGLNEKAAETFLMGGFKADAAEAYDLAGQSSKAAGLYEEALMFEAAGLIHEKISDFDRAVECYRRAGKPYRAGRLLLKSDRLKEALGMFDTVDGDDPDYLMSQAETGICLYKMGDVGESLAILEKSLENIGPDSDTMDAFYTLGLAYEAAGKRNDARKVYRRIISENPSYCDVQERVDKLSSAVSEPSEQTADKTIKTTEPSSGISQRYRIIKELGRGGMGVVSQARDILLERNVALKQLSASAFNEKESHERFLREARAASRLNHPNIVSVYDVLDDGKAPAIAMEYVDGVSLKKYLREHPTRSMKLVYMISLQAAEGLRAAHDRGVIHRDVKPDNILLTRKGQVKITDFGIAHMADSTITATGMVMGTLKYMSPEQVTGQKISEASDIYSFGVVLYEMAAGTPPFTEGDMGYHHVHTAPKAPSQLNPGVSPALEKVIMKCLEKKPAARYRSFTEVIEDLKAGQKEIR